MHNNGVATAKSLRDLVRSSRHGALSTLSVNGDRRIAGWPSTSLVMIAATAEAEPILLISTLADHTKNLAADSRCSLLLVTDPGTDHPRLTLYGTAEVTDEITHRSRYMARHPDSALYAGFADFSFFKLAVDRAYWIGGFGRQRWLKGADFRPEARGPAETSETGLIAYMNDRHSRVFATIGLARGWPAHDWKMTSLDAEGFEMVSETLGWHRISFESPLDDLTDAHDALIRLANGAGTTRM